MRLFRHWRRPAGVDRAINGPHPGGMYKPVDWKFFHEQNARRVERYGEEARIPADEFEAAWYEMQKPRPAPIRLTRAQVEHLQNHLYRNGIGPLSAKDKLELMGVDVTELTTGFQQIEADYRLAVERGEAELTHMAELGYPVPLQAHQKVRELADAQRDAAISAQRDLVFSAAKMLRENYQGDAYQAKLNAAVIVPDDKAQQMKALMANVRDMATLRRLHAQAVRNGDEAGAFYIESNGAEHLASIPGRAGANPDVEAYELRQLADQQRARRAGPAYQHIVDAEAELDAAIRETNSHLTSGEASAMTQTLGLTDDTLFRTAPVGTLRLPAADPIFD